jgi:hypothetical protein
MVECPDRPCIRRCHRFMPTCIYHGLNRENHSRLKLESRANFTMVKNLWFLVENRADSMPAIVSDDAIAVRFGVGLDRVSDVAESRAGSNLLDS